MLVTPHDGCWVTPFGHPRITARLTTPRGLSRPPTSFIGSRCPDIHPVPYNTTHTTNPHKPQNQTQKRCSHPLCNTQHTTTHQPPQPPPHPQAPQGSHQDAL